MESGTEQNAAHQPESYPRCVSEAHSRMPDIEQSTRNSRTRSESPFPADGVEKVCVAMREVL